MRASIGNGRRLQAERRRVGGQGVEVLRPADTRADLGGDVEQADVAHALQVGPHGVRVQAQGLGDVGGGERRGERASSR